MATLRQTVTALLPTVHYAFNEPAGSTTVAQLGSSAAPAATISGSPSLGFPGVLRDGSGETVCYQTAGNADVGWHIANHAAFTFAAADAFTIMAVVAAYVNQAQDPGCIFAQYGCTPGFVQLKVGQTGFVAIGVQDNSNVTVTNTSFPPSLNDGVPHVIGLVRTQGPKTVEFWQDAQLVAKITDPTVNPLTNATTANRIGCSINCGGFFGFTGAYSNVAIFRSTFGAAQFELVRQALWNGAPPPPGSGIPSIATAVGQTLADLDLILQSVRKTY